MDGSIWIYMDFIVERSIRMDDWGYPNDLGNHQMGTKSSNFADGTHIALSWLWVVERQILPFEVRAILAGETQAGISCGVCFL